MPLERPIRARSAPPPALVAEGAPALRLDRTSRCFERAVGGRWRAQCDATTKTLPRRARRRALGRGRAGGGPRPRVRVRRCRGGARTTSSPQGYELVAALAESPPGWRRDERQRVMQVNFDLDRRIWLGAGYGVGQLPVVRRRARGPPASAGTCRSASLGAPALARVRALETFVALRRRRRRLHRCSASTPRAPTRRRSSASPPSSAGRGASTRRSTSAAGSRRSGSSRSAPDAAAGSTGSRVGAAALTLDLWRSRDLASFVRLRGGAGYEMVDQLDGAAWMPHAGADARPHARPRRLPPRCASPSLAEWLVTTGANGFQPEDPAVPRLPAHRTGYTGKAEYESILLAVNDQPLSARRSTRAPRAATTCPDLADELARRRAPPRVRFNLWAPPRRDAPVQEQALGARPMAAGPPRARARRAGGRPVRRDRRARARASRVCFDPGNRLELSAGAAAGRARAGPRAARSTSRLGLRWRQRPALAHRGRSSGCATDLPRGARRSSPRATSSRAPRARSPGAGVFVRHRREPVPARPRPAAAPAARSRSTSGLLVEVGGAAWDAARPARRPTSPRIRSALLLDLGGHGALRRLAFGPGGRLGRARLGDASTPVHEIVPFTAGVLDVRAESRDGLAAARAHRPRRLVPRGPGRRGGLPRGRPSPSSGWSLAVNDRPVALYAEGGLAGRRGGAAARWRSGCARRSAVSGDAPGRHPRGYPPADDGTRGDRLLRALRRDRAADRARRSPPRSRAAATTRTSSSSTASPPTSASRTAR